jgi:hypothetical protein
VIPQIDQYLGNLFSRGQPITALKDASYGELKYWNEWHEIMAKKEAG